MASILSLAKLISIAILHLQMRRKKYASKRLKLEESFGILKNMSSKNKLFCSPTNS